jgi:hypothetical protein
MQRRYPLVDKKVINNITLNKRSLHKAESDSADASRPLGYKVRGKEISAPLDISREYAEWEHLFQEELTSKALPKHKPWDYEIKLQEGKELPFRPIYGLSEKELKVLYNYI